MQGSGLATEIIASSEDYRAFIKIKAINSSGFINSSDIENIKFWLRKYEIRKEFIDNDWDVSDDELINSVYINDIIGIQQLEQVLSKFLNNFALLDVEWKCDNPL